MVLSIFKLTLNDLIVEDTITKLAHAQGDKQFIQFEYKASQF
jgi:hypothetical protein